MSRAKLLSALDLKQTAIDELLDTSGASEFFLGLRPADGPWTALSEEFADVARGQLRADSLVDALTSIDLPIADEGERELAQLDPRCWRIAGGRTVRALEAPDDL
jgi:hypothetical protein